MRTIVHVDMDAFYCAVEAKANPHYRGKPLIVGGHRHSPRAVVSSCSYEARRYGVRSAMPIAQAARLCPQGIFIPCNMALYQQVSAQVHAVFHELSPVVEPISIDEAFLDMTGSEHFYDSLESMGHAIKRRVYEAVGCSASAGIAPCKFLAKLASDLQKPDGLVVVRPADIDALLLPLPVSNLWGVGEKHAATLGRLGVHTVADVRKHSVAWLTRHLGTLGATLHELAYGIDNRSVEPPGPRKSIGHEVTFSTDVKPGQALLKQLDEVAGQVAARLQADGRYGRAVTLKVRYADFSTLTRRCSVPGGAHSAGDIATAARRLLTILSPARPIRLIGIYVSDLSPFQQLGLFADPRSLVVEQLQKDINTPGGHLKLTTAAQLASRGSFPGRKQQGPEGPCR